MKKFYLSAFFLVSLFLTEKTTAQVTCHASFYLDTVNSAPFNAVLVNNSVTYLTPPDSAIYFWMWGDGTSSTGKNPTHTYTSPGTKYIVLSLTNVNKTCSDSFMKAITIDTAGGFHKTNAAYTLRVVMAGATGINSTLATEIVSIIPGVVKNQAKFSFGDAVSNNAVKISIFSYDGKNVMTVSGNINGNSMAMDMTELPAGMYFAIVNADGKLATVRFVKE